MEKNANYALVGLVTLVLTVGLIIFVVWLARLGFNNENDVYDVVFQGPVRGLSDGGEVHFNGIKVGEVTRIGIDAVNPKNVVARIRVSDTVPIRTDSYATLEPQGITGLNYIQITAGTATRPLLKDTVDRDEVPILKSQRSALSDLLEGGGTVLTRTIESLDRVNRVLSDQNIKTFSATLADAQAVSAELRARKEIIADAQQALQRVDEATQEIVALTRSSREIVETDGRKMVGELAAAAEEARAASADVRTLIGRLQGPATEFATTGLPQVTTAVIQLQTTAESLERLLNEVQRSPAGALARPPAEELEIPQ